jgi:23S rRNA (cytosine1962-C5)-methyltransferase
MKQSKQLKLVPFVCPPWEDYELLDSGMGKKLERFGAYNVVRPAPQAHWQPTSPRTYWETAHASFKETPDRDRGRWEFREQIPSRWVMEYNDLRFWVQPTPFGHMGVFPEQASLWNWIRDLLRTAQRPINVLNLFGHTGLATLAAAAAGASVTHVDASKKAVTWARENQALSALEDRPIRWIVDDALKFVQREARRQVRYDGLILDPPKFGRGPRGEVWSLNESLPVLLRACTALLSEEPVFVALTTYPVRHSDLKLYHALEEMLADRRGVMTMGELVLVQRSTDRLLSAAMAARWSHDHY